MSLPKGEVKCRLDEHTFEAFKAICDLEGVGYAQKGEELLANFVKSQMHQYMLARQKFERLGYLGNLRDLVGMR